MRTVGDELKQAIKRQVEFYFSKTNLATDAFLVSNMNSQMYVASASYAWRLPRRPPVSRAYNSRTASCE